MKNFIREESISSFLKKSVILSSFVLVSACGHLPGYGVGTIPTQINTASNIKSMSKKYTKAVDGDEIVLNSWIDKSEKCLEATISSSPSIAECKTYRNGMISEMLLIVDYNYHSYEGNLLAGRAKTDFYIGAARTGLETAATLFTPVDTKTILSALATASGTVKSSAEKDFYYDQTGPALISMMRSDRKTVETRILEQQNKPSYSDYPIAAAVRDMAAYYRAGTMASAVSSLASAAGKIEAIAEEKLKEETAK